MASKPVFTILCVFQMIIGFLTFVFGMIDRIGIQMQISFLMLPIWNGVLFEIAGFAGLFIGRQNRKQGYISSGATSGVKAINVLCFGLSLLTFYMYGSVVMNSGFRIALNEDWQNWYPTFSPVPKQPSTRDGTTDDDTRQGIFAMIIIFSLVEMFLGAWIFMLDKEKMVMGSSTSSDQVPLIVAEPNQYIQPAAQYAQPNTGVVVASPQVLQQQQQQQQQYIQPAAQYVQPNTGVVVASSQVLQQQQQQQQPVYVVAAGGNAPMPARAVVAPINQQQQQPNFVMLQPSAGNQPQVIQRPRPQYVLMQNQVPTPPPAAHVNQGDPADVPTLPVHQQDQPDVRTTDSPAPQPGDIRLTQPIGPM